MKPSLIVAAVLLIAAGSFLLGRRRALLLADGKPAALRSLPGYYGWYAALWAGLPGLAIAVLWLVASSWALDRVTLGELPGPGLGGGDAERSLFLNEVRSAARGDLAVEKPLVAAAAERYRALRRDGIATALALAVVLSTAGGLVALRGIRPQLVARVGVERLVRAGLLLCSTIAILVTAGILLSLLFEALRFFEAVPVTDFLFGLHWSPQTALRADQVGSSGSFGAVPVFAGTLLITLIAMGVAVPIGLLSAIYATCYASHTVRAALKPLLEVLAGVPTVVYGFFAALVIAPFIRRTGMGLGLDVASESALAAGLVMGIMIIPFVSSLSDDAITAVPHSLVEGSFGLGATRSETIRFVILPAALPGIMGAFLLAVSRAIGETMIVVMAAGFAANLTINPLEAVTTVTVQIVGLLTGDQEFDSAKTLSAFALGLVLFIATLGLNVVALRIVQKYRERYE
jgi:phosphate transport system permease protein